MEKYLPYIIFIGVAILLALILKFVWKIGGKRLVALICNTIVGGIILFVINMIPGVYIPITIFYSIIVGIAGVPGVIFVVIYELFIK